MYVDGGEQCVLDHGYLWEQRDGQWDGGLYVFGQYDNISPDGDIDDSRADFYGKPEHLRPNIFKPDDTVVKFSSIIQRQCRLDSTERLQSDAVDGGKQ